MKSSYGTAFLIFFFLSIFVILPSSCSISAARHLPQGEEEKLLLKAGGGVTDTQLEDITILMGAEESEGQECDDECVKRRMIAEAHLDYIYTQNHNP